MDDSYLLTYWMMPFLDTMHENKIWNEWSYTVNLLS